MNRENILRQCKTCNHRKMSLQLGLICSLTNQQGNFEGTCPHYNRDAVAFEKEEKKEKKAMEIQDEFDELIGTKKEKSTSNAMLNIIFGFIFLIAGLALTFSDSGRIFYGAIIVGAFKVIRGIIELAS